MVFKWNLVICTFFAIIFCIGCVQSQVNAPCHFPRLTPRHALNLNKLMGQWFLHEFAASDRGFDNANPKFKCNQLNYVPEGSVEKGGKFKSMEAYQNSTTGQIQRIEIPINVPNLASPVSSIWDAQTLNGDTKMVVLNIDREHEEWFVLYSCSISVTKKYRWETVGIWSRTRILNPIIREVLKDFLIGLGFPTQSHKFHSQEDCTSLEQNVHSRFNINTLR